MSHENIEQKCIETYQTNIEFLEENFKEVAKKISLLNRAIDNSVFQVNWELEYKEDGKYFDLLNIKNDYFYYGINTNDDSDLVVKNYKFDEKNSFNNVRFINPPKNYKVENDIVEYGYQHLFPIINFINKHSNKEHDYRRIDKFIFLGTGLGMHIPKLASKLKSKSYIIIEPNIELFRLSLFTTDYTKLLDDPQDLFLSVGQTDAEFEKTFNAFYNKFSLLNYRFKFHCVTESYHKYFDLIANILNVKDPLNFPFNVQLKSLKRNVDYLYDNYKVAIYDYSALKRFPACIVAPGPSLEKGGIEWLKTNKDKFLIIALGASLKKLEKNGIKPDIITSVDPHDITKNQFELEDENFLNDTIFLCSTNTHPDIVEKFEKKNVCFYSVMFNIINKYQSPLGGTTIGEITYALALIFGIKELYLFGTDVALDPDSGASHSKEHIHYHKKELKKTELKEFNAITNDDLVEVDGNLRDKVFTTRKFYTVINHYNQFSMQYKNTQKVYNTSDGAKLNGIEPIEYKDINTSRKVFDKKNLNTTLQDIFSKFSQEGFSDDNRSDAENDLEVIKKILQNIKKYKKNKFKTYDKFQYDRLGLIIDNVALSKNLQFSFTLYITNSYMQVVDNMIYNFFEKDLKNKSNKTYINTLNNYWLSPYEKIYKFLEHTLEKIIGSKKSET